MLSIGADNPGMEKRRVGIAGKPVGRALAAALLLVLVLWPPVAPARPGHLFGYGETENDNLAPFAKWNGMLKRYFADARRELAEGRNRPGGCEESFFNVCHYAEWTSLIERLRGRGLMEQLRAVNAHMNEAPYITDPRNWGVPDYWATPAEFFEKDGDCEDYAIAKYLTLRRLGVPANRMRIVVLQDMNLRVGHAVLAVYDDNAVYILDNQISEVVEDTAIRHYRPLYSINEAAWWLHTPPRG